MKKYILFALVSLTSSLSFAQTNSTFLVKAVGHFCYQDAEDAYQQALSRLQMKADEICNDSKAIRVTNISQTNKECAITIQARFICE